MALIKDINNYKKLVIRNNSKIKKSIKNNINNFNIKKQLKNIINRLSNGIIIDSHLSHYLPNKYVDLCIVLKCDLRQLKNRLKEKKYSKEKIRENLNAEIFDVCLNEAKEFKHKLIIVDTTRDININKISKKLGLL